MNCRKKAGWSKAFHGKLSVAKMGMRWRECEKLERRIRFGVEYVGDIVAYWMD
jgi:hypothetical protein